MHPNYIKVSIHLVQISSFIESMLPVVVPFKELLGQTIPNAFRIFIGTEEGKLFIDSNKETGYYPSRSNEIGPIYIIDDSSG